MRTLAARGRALPLIAAMAVSAACGTSAAVPTTPLTSVTGAPPVASLRIAGQAHPPLVLVGLPVTFDASASTGAGLTYELTFGDGRGTTAPMGEHELIARGNLTATAKVTDASGRSDTASIDYLVEDLSCLNCGGWWVANEPTAPFQPQLAIGVEHGTLFGDWTEPTYHTPIVGAFTPDLHFTAKTVHAGTPVVTLTGRVWLNSSGADCFHITCLAVEATLDGGHWSGQTLTFHWYTDY